jgi:2-polyprenyl-3-methyl-5-hydroxy-6-metoxy-1,4-benzoquinol methylase
MPPSYLQSLLLLHQSSRSLPAATKAHILGRFLTCPYLRTLPFINRGDTVLDLGAGHATFARLAVASGAKRVIAVEPDLRKTFSIPRASSIHYVAAFDDAVRGEFDLISMFDVLYRIPIREWDALFARCFDRIRPGGTILIKELDPEQRTKFLWNRTQEWISDRFLKITLGSEFSYQPREAIRSRLEAAGFTAFRAIDIGRGYPHSHVAYLATRP